MKTYTPEDLTRLAETIVEVTSCLTPSLWESAEGNRLSVAGDVLALALATEEVQKAEGFEWGDVPAASTRSYDYFEFTELLASAYETWSAEKGYVAGKPGAAEEIVRGALRATLSEA